MSIGRKRKKNTVLSLLIVLFLFGVIAFIFVYSLYSDCITLKDTNAEMVNELSEMRKEIYIALVDIEEGEEFITSGDDANIQLEQIYTSFDDSIFYYSGDGFYAQRDISAGDPILKVDGGNAIIEEEVVEVVSEVEPEYTIPYDITAIYVDENGDEIWDSDTLQLSSGVTEQCFSSFAADVGDGYKLSSISVEGASVYSFGITNIQSSDSMISMCYYTDSSGLSRVQILGDIEVVFSYSTVTTVEDDGYQDNGLLIIDAEEEQAYEEGLYAAITAESVQ